MGRKALLSYVQRARIVTLHEEGHSERKIAVKMACSKTAVHTTINNFELYGNYSDKKKSGRPRKTSRRNDHMMKLTFKISNQFLQKIQANLLQKLPKPFLKQVSLYFLQELVGNLETVSFIMWSSLSEVFLGRPLFFLSEYCNCHKVQNY